MVNHTDIPYVFRHQVLPNVFKLSSEQKEKRAKQPHALPVPQPQEIKTRTTLYFE